MQQLYYKAISILIFILFFGLIKAQDFTSNLPIVLIDTFKDEIVDEPDILAQITVIDNGDGNIHTSNDSPKYTGFITIELRGNSSLDFPKSSYGFETADAQGNDIDTTLLGFPVEEDWILYSSWADKTFLRNALSMKLSREMGHYASQTRFCELFVNEEYQGLYVLMEKIKRDKNRVDIAKLNPEDIEGNELTGGYILKFDWWEEPGWEAGSETVLGQDLYIQYVYPKPENLEWEQEQYIQSYIDSFELALFADDYTNEFGKHYSDYLDTESFADFIIVNELSKNVDAYKLSTYFHKKKDSDGGKLHAGPIWDFDIAWYNSDYCAGGSYEDWIFNEPYCEDLDLMPRWWERLMGDSNFAQIFCERWQFLRTDVLHQDSILNWIDEQAQFLDDAQTRNYDFWESLEEWTWAHPEIAGSYSGEVENLKEFIINRIEWMDENINCQALSGIELEEEEEEEDLFFQIMPNPTEDYIALEFYGEEYLENVTIQLFSSLGELMLEFEDDLHSNEFYYEFNLMDFPSGVYHIVILHESDLLLQEKVVKF